MHNKMLRCAIYIRVSTTEQMIHGKSLEAQREHLLKICEGTWHGGCRIVCR